MPSESPGSSRPPASPPVTLVAPAKLTRSLRVTGVRADGYHLIDAEMVALDLADTIELTTTAEATAVEVVDAAAGPRVDVGAVEQNLVARALALVGRQAHVR